MAVAQARYVGPTCEVLALVQCNPRPKSHSIMNHFEYKCRGDISSNISLILLPFFICSIEQHINYIQQKPKLHSGKTCTRMFSPHLYYPAQSGYILDFYKKSTKVL
jgi:hypothetical protein